MALAPVLYWNDRKSAVLTGVAGVLTVVSMVALSSPVSVDLATSALMVALFALAWMRPRLLLWVTLVYPFAALYLLWGGRSGPISAPWRLSPSAVPPGSFTGARDVRS